MKLRTLTTTAFLTFVAITMAAAQSGHDRFQQGLLKERAEGNIQGAIQIFEGIIRDFASDRALVAKTLIQLGGCHEKLVKRGDTEARRAYDRVIREFADQEDAVREARTRLTALRPDALPQDLVTRRLVTGPDVNGAYSITADGRLMASTAWDTGDLVIREMSTGQVWRLMAKPGTFKDTNEFAENPVFSPDASQLAYGWFDGKQYQLRAMPSVPGAKALVLRNIPETRYVQPGAWSRDSKSILITMQKFDKTEQLALVSVPGGVLKVLKPLERRSPGWAKFSPAGDYIAYSAREASDSADKRSIYLLTADGTSCEFSIGCSPGVSPRMFVVTTPKQTKETPR